MRKQAGHERQTQFPHRPDGSAGTRRARRQHRRHTGMIRIGNLPASRWCMVQALASTRQIVGAIMGAS
jgi:hypothetical protein